MSTKNAEIRAAIDSFDIDRARTLLRDALKEADADTYYLAAQVALNDDQKRDFLKKAADLDPFHAKAHAELKKLSGAGNVAPPPPPPSPSPSPTYTAPASSSFSFAPPSDAPASSMTAATQSSTFNISNAIGIAIIGGAIVGILVALDWLTGLPFETGNGATWLDWISYPLAGALLGFIVSYVVGQLIPDLAASEKQGLVIGCGLAWLLALIFNRTIFWNLQGEAFEIIANMTEGFLVAFVIANALRRFEPNRSGAVFFAWIISYVVVVVFWLVWPDLDRTIYRSDVPTVVLPVVIGNAICLAVGCFITLNHLRKQRSSTPTA